MISKLLIYRKRRTEFNSIENVFDALTTFLDSNKMELPFFSQGILSYIKNIAFIRKQNAMLNHITGSDHYLAIGLKKRTVILTIHDIEILKRTTGLKRYILKKLWFDLPIKNAAIVTTISEFSKSELLKLNNYKTPIVVIPNPMTLPIKQSTKYFNNKCPTILHLGVKPNKNLPRLIEALNGISCQLVIIGKENQNTIELLQQNNINYIFKSNLSNKEVIDEYKNCDIVAFLSTYEGFGLPIIEAQAIGRPVITSNVASMPKVAGNGALIVDPFSTSDIKKGILRLINEEELRISLIQKGLKNIIRFEPKEVAQKYSEVYNEILSKQ